MSAAPTTIEHIRPTTHAARAERGVCSTYDGSKILFRFLRTYGWGPLLNCGYFSCLNAFTLFGLPFAQRRLVRKAVDLLDLKPGDSVLDVACGRGWSSNYIACSQPVRKVVGIDLLPAHLATCQGLYGNTPRLQYHEGDATALRFDDRSFDAVICIEAAFHFDRQKFISEAFRVLRPGGRLVIVDFMWQTGVTDAVLNHPDMRVVRSIWNWDDFDSIEEYRAKVARAGFEVRALRDWSRNVMSAFYYFCRAASLAGCTRAGRWLLTALNSQLKALGDAEWEEVDAVMKAHDYARRPARYIALGLVKP